MTKSALTILTTIPSSSVWKPNVLIYNIYTIHAKSSVGEDTAEFDITILGKPGRPNGPLEASDMTKNECKLKWNKPDDDGGAPVCIYFF